VARTTPQVGNGVLVYHGETQLETVAVGSAAWWRWLDDPRTTTFRVNHPMGAFTARKEHRQRGSSYWYAYRTQGGRRHKSYLGRAEALTLRRLEEVATHLAGGQPPPREPAVASKDEHPPGQPTPAQDTALLPDALLASKLYMPRPRPNLVRRPRLTERLSAGLRGPLTLLVAPAGFGKTTLLADWRTAQQQGAWPVAWLALDAGDNDLARFLRYLVAALQALRADLGRVVLPSLRSPQPPPVEALLTLLLNDLVTHPGAIVLVLDDYHVVDTPPIHQAMAFLLEHLPPQVHLVIAARADPPLPLARLRARGQLTELRAADLRFTAEEAATFLHHSMGLPLSADDVAALGAHTEGWIAGLQLAALALHGRDSAHLSEAIAALTGGHRYILDYLADEVFEHQPADVRHFLLRTSVLDRLSGALCDALVGETGDALATGDGQAMLERLEAANLFLVPLDDTRTWYRYHHLFAAFLRQRLRREAPDLVPELHRRACRWYEQQGLATEAADHALAAHDDELAARLVEQAIPALLWQRGETAAPLRWVERLPRDVARPRLCLDLAWVSLWSAQVGAVEPWLHDAEHALDTAAPPAGLNPDTTSRALRGEIVAIRAQLARQQGELSAAIALARQALADLPTDERRVRGVTAGLLGGAYLWSGDAAAASQAYAEAVALSEASGTIILTLIASGRLVLTQALQGRLHQAATTYRQTLELATTYGMAATPALGVAQVAMGEVLREWNDLDTAEDLLRQGIAHCAGSGGRRAEVALDGYLTLARVVQARGDSEGALAVLAQAEALGREWRVTQYAERVAVARARLWLTSPRGPGGARAPAGAPEDAWHTDETLGYVGLLARLTLARLCIMQGRREEAATLLQRLLESAEAGGLRGCVLEILALRARLFLEQDQMAQAMITLSRALALAEPEGYVRLFVDEGAPMVTLLRHAQARGMMPAYVATLLTACGSARQAPSPTASVLVEPLSARERELLHLLAAGLSTPEIATQLFLTTGTVRNHLKHIYRKLAVHSRLQAVERARTLGLL
jgi:LuxR family maltose regulon positive regulatory protein